MNFDQNLNKLKNYFIKNQKDEIDIIYYLQIFVNLESVIDQLINIYYFNSHLNFRVVIWINKINDNYTNESGELIKIEDLKNLNLPSWIIVFKFC